MCTITAQQVFGFDNLDSCFVCIPRILGIAGIFIKILLKVKFSSVHAVGFRCRFALLDMANL